MDEYMGIIKMFGGNFSPKGFMFCQGQIISIAANTALFSIIGTTFGGDGQSTFALPDLRGRVPVGVGTPPGMAAIQLGQAGGTSAVTIQVANMPAHTHGARVTVTPPINADSANTENPEGAYMAISNTQIYNTTAGSGQTSGSYPAQATVAPAGGSQPLPIMNPFLGLSYIICTEGIFPSRD